MKKIFFALSILLAVTGPAAAGDDPIMDWAGLRNPVLSIPDRMLKDQAVVHIGPWFYLFASTRFEDGSIGGGGQPCFFRTYDFKEWERLTDPGLTLNFDGRAFLAASPDVVRQDRAWYAVFQAGPGDYFRRLYFSTSSDLEHWSPAAPINPGMKPRQRQIDGALAFESGHWVLGYKGDQNFYVTMSKGPELDGRWGKPIRASADGQWAENFQFIKIDGRWRMVATGRERGAMLADSYTAGHMPYLYQMDGAGDRLQDWARWIDRTPLGIPGEDWNTVMVANSGYLCDWREYDGHFYLFYSGANDNTRFARRGHGQIGMARSRDLVHWKLPGQGD